MKNIIQVSPLLFGLLVLLFYMAPLFPANVLTTSIGKFLAREETMRR